MTTDAPFKCPYALAWNDLHGYQGKVKADISPSACHAMMTRGFRQCLKCEKKKECEEKCY